MRSPLVATFHETLSYCFNSTLQTMGRSIRDYVYAHLESNGIRREEISGRFDDVVQVLTGIFGPGTRVIVYKTLVELHKEYSQPAQFG